MNWSSKGIFSIVIPLENVLVLVMLVFGEITIKHNSKHTTDEQRITFKYLYDYWMNDLFTSSITIMFTILFVYTER